MCRGVRREVVWVGCSGSGRTEKVDVRLTAAEAARVRARARAAGLRPSQCMRREALRDGEALRVEVDVGRLRDVLYQLKKAGNNANQIAREMHRWGAADAVPMAAVEAAARDLSDAAMAVCGALSAARG